MLSCKQASQLVSQSLERQLSGGERFKLRFHLLICRFCKRFAQQLALIKLALKKQVASIENDEKIRLSQSAQKRIAQAINSVFK